MRREMECPKARVTQRVADVDPAVVAWAGTLHTVKYHQPQLWKNNENRVGQFLLLSYPFLL